MFLQYSGRNVFSGRCSAVSWFLPLSFPKSRLLDFFSCVNVSFINTVCVVEEPSTCCIIEQKLRLCWHTFAQAAWNQCWDRWCKKWSEMKTRMWSIIRKTFFFPELSMMRRHPVDKEYGLLKQNHPAWQRQYLLYESCLLEGIRALLRFIKSLAFWHTNSYCFMSNKIQKAAKNRGYI